MDELKPCPFCGVAPKMLKRPMWQSWNGITHGYFGCYEFIIECENEECLCRVKMDKNDTIYRTEEEAKQNCIRSWNRRIERREMTGDYKWIKEDKEAAFLYGGYRYVIDDEDIERLKKGEILNFFVNDEYGCTLKYDKVLK